MAQNKITYEVTEKLGTLSENPNGWNKEVRVICWNERAPKLDIREWGTNEEGEERMSKGLTLTFEEGQLLYEILKERYED